MRSDCWHLTEDVDAFLARAGEFLRSRPALHTMPLTVTETLRTSQTPRTSGADACDAEAPVFGSLERSGKVTATFYHRPPGLLNVTPLAPEHADTLAAHLADLGHILPGVSAEHRTARTFAAAWHQYTGATPTLREQRLRLYRLGTLAAPESLPAGRGRLAGEQDREQLMRWCGEFAVTVGEVPAADADAWARSRFAHKRFMFWETADGTPVSMAGMTPMVAGQIRVDPVYTPAHLRGRGYAGAVTVAVSRAALDAGATDVVLYADPNNATSNALYQRIGYRLIAGWGVYDFA